MARSWVLVTGGNRGIGLHAAILLAKQRKRVLIAARSSAAGAEAVQAVQKAVPGAEVQSVLLDMSSPDSIQAAVQDLSKRFGRTIDVLVNNAGINIQGWDAKILESILQTNLDGPLQLTHAYVGSLAPDSGGLVVMVASELGQFDKQDPKYAEELLQATTLEGVREVAHTYRDSEFYQNVWLNCGAYYLSKAALNRCVQLLAQDPEYAKANVAVVSACPGWCNTDMGSAAAPRTPVQGAESVTWWVDHYEASLNGSFYRDGAVLAW